MTDVLPKAIVIGASGGIASALIEQLLASKQYTVHSVSRRSDGPAGCQHWVSDYSDDSMASVATSLAEAPGELARVFITNGILHGDDLRPERALKQLRRDSLQRTLEANTIVPMLWLSALADALKCAPAPKVAVLSARIGSLGDNGLGGWHSYRASKAALNMMLKCAAIELKRTNPQAKFLAFHPGTTDTALSKPFQRGVPEDKLFTPEFVAERLLSIVDELPRDGELSYLDWAGKTIPW